MTTHIQKGEMFLGVPMIGVRNVLSAWRWGKSKDAGYIAKRKDVNMDTRVVMVLLDELRDRGLIGPEKLEGGKLRDGLTDGGLALATAKAQPPISKSAATRIFNKILEACEAVNRADNLAFYVRTVWLAGSMIDPAKSEVGDIDFAIETKRKAGMSFKAAEEWYDRYADKHNIAAPDWRINGKESAVQRRLLYGKARNSRLAPLDIQKLVSMACPCQLVFDRVRGRVRGAVLPKHPSAKHKTRFLHDVLSVPNLSAGEKPLRPLPVDLFTPLKDLRYTARTNCILPARASHLQFGMLDELHLHCVTSKHPFNHETTASYVLDELDFRDCDGREKFGLLISKSHGVDKSGEASPREMSAWKYVHTPICGLVVERSIRETTQKVLYELSIVSAELEGGIDQDILIAHCWLYFLATADIEHIRLRVEDEGMARKFLVRVTGDNRVVTRMVRNLNNDLAKYIKEMTAFTRVA